MNIILFYSEVVLGEHRVDTDPDCSGDGKCSPPKITRGIKEIITHEGYDSESNFKHDIALINHFDRKAEAFSFICLYRFPAL